MKNKLEVQSVNNTNTENRNKMRKKYNKLTNNTQF